MPRCEFILEKLKSQEPTEVREACFLAGEENCTEAIPILVSLLRNSNIGIQEAAELSLRKLGGEITIQALIPLLWEDDVSVRNVAVDILRDIGEQGVDILLDLLYEEDSDVRIFALDILGNIKSIMVIKPLCDILLSDPDPNVRSQAAISLGKLGYMEAVSCLEEALEDEEWVRFAAIEALKRIGSEASAETLINYLGKGSDLIDAAIIDALAEMGKIRLVPSLLNKLDTDNIPLRNKIIQALVTLLGSRTLELLTEEQRNKFEGYLIEALADESRDVQVAALKGLGCIKNERTARAILDFAAPLDEEKDEDLLEQIKDILKEFGVTNALLKDVQAEDEKRSLFAIRLLCEMEQPEARKVLMDIFWEKDRDIQREISRALCDRGGEEVKDFFLDVLKKHKDGKVIKNALKFLGEKVQMEDSAPELLKFLEHPYDDVKEVALNACIALGSEYIKEKFVEMASSENPLHRLMAIYALGRLGEERFLPYIQRALEDEEADIRKVAVESYTLCCGEEDKIIENIVPRLQDISREVRVSALDALYQLKNKDKVVSYVVGKLEDDDDWVKMRAIEILGEIKHGFDISVLEPILKGNNNLLKIKAIETLDKIESPEATRLLIDFLREEKNPEVQVLVEKILTKKT